MNDLVRKQAGDVPVISSIDAGIARQMFGDDVALFSSALSLLLRDHAEFSAPITALLEEESTRSQLQVRVHALRGSTGLLGATYVMSLAGEAETALEQGRSSEVVAPILGQLTSAFARLRDEGMLWLERQAKEALFDGRVVRQPSTGGPENLDELYSLLHSRNLAALDKFGSLSSSLSERLGPARFSSLRDAINNMDFALGAQLLRQGMIASAQRPLMGAELAPGHVNERQRPQTDTRASAPNTDLQVLLVDDHDIVRVGIMSLLERAGNMRVIGGVGTGEAAVLAASRLCPDVIVMDLVLPDLNGIDAMRRILAERPRTHIVALSACRTSEHVRRSMQAGARGYVTKTSVGLDLVPAINAVVTGNQYVSSGIVPVTELGGLRCAGKATGQLSAREREVLRLLVAGLSSAGIGRQLLVSPKSIDTYRHRIMVKLGVANRAALIRVAIEYDLITV